MCQYGFQTYTGCQVNKEVFINLPIGGSPATMVSFGGFPFLGPKDFWNMKTNKFTKGINQRSRGRLLIEGSGVLFKSRETHYFGFHLQ